MAANGVTVICDAAEVGDTGVVAGVEYTKRIKDKITTSNAATTCTSGITDMYRMFNRARDFNQDIGSWDTSSVTNMERMFRDTKAFNQNLSGWKVDNADGWGFDNGADTWNEDYKPNFP